MPRQVLRVRKTVNKVKYLYEINPHGIMCSTWDNEKKIYVIQWGYNIPLIIQNEERLHVKKLLELLMHAVFKQQTVGVDNG